MRYAQINEIGVVIGISNLSGEVDHSNMILIEDYPDVDLGMIYDKEKNSWEEAPEPEPEPEPEEPEPTGPTLEEKIDQIDQMIMATMSAVVELGLKGGEF